MRHVCNNNRYNSNIFRCLNCSRDKQELKLNQPQIHCSNNGQFINSSSCSNISYNNHCSSNNILLQQHQLSKQHPKTTATSAIATANAGVKSVIEGGAFCEDMMCKCMKVFKFQQIVVVWRFPIKNTTDFLEVQNQYEVYCQRVATRVLRFHLIHKYIGS